MNRTNTKLIRNTDPGTAFLINQLFNKGIIVDFSEDGWVLFKKEWIPIGTFLERYYNKYAEYFSE